MFVYDDIKIGLQEAIEYEKGHLKANTKTLSNITGKEIMQGVTTEIEEIPMSELFKFEKHNEVVPHPSDICNSICDPIDINAGDELEYIELGGNHKSNRGVCRKR